MSPEDVEEIYTELDLEEEGITEEEILRRKTRIFVGGLKFASEDHVLYDYFIQFGEIKEAVVIRDRKKNGLSKGYGFVTMNDEKTALLAIVDKSPKLDGRRCNVNLAYIGQKKKPPAKKRDMRLMEIPMLPQQHMYTVNGYPVSPSIVTQNGQIYTFGLPPLHGHQPMYHFPSASSPGFEPVENLPGHSPCNVSPMSPMFQPPVFFSQPYIINNHVSAINNNSMLPVSTSHYPLPLTAEEQTVDLNNNNNNNNNNKGMLNTDNNNNDCINVYTKPPNTSMLVKQNITPTDSIPLTSSMTTSYNDQPINGGATRQIISNENHQINNGVHLFNGQHFTVNTKQVPINNNNNTIINNNNNNVNTISSTVDINGVTTMIKGAYITPNNAQMISHNGITQMQPPEATQPSHYSSTGEHMMEGPNCLTTYITSPLPSPLMQNTNQMPFYHLQPYVTHHKEIIQ